MAEKKSCITCIKICSSLEKNQLKSLLVDGKTVFSSVSQRPNAKAHTVIMTKRHCLEMKDMTNQEWADILPVLQESIKKIDNCYHPLGYRITIPLGELAGQNMPQHFYMSVVPKYKKDYGYIGCALNYENATPEKYKELKNCFNSQEEDNVLMSSSRLVVKLDEYLSSVITTKAHLPSDINSIDQETWNEIGQMLKELMQKMEEADVAHNFRVSFSLGEKSEELYRKEREESLEDPSSEKRFNSRINKKEINIFLAPKFKLQRYWLPHEGARPLKNNQLAGTMENERVAEKLNNPKEYAKTWGKIPSSTRKNQQDPSISPQQTQTQERERERDNKPTTLSE